MAKLQSLYAAPGDSMDSLRCRGYSELTCRGVPLPYLIRPRRKLPLYDSFALYNDYIEDSSMEDGFSYESDDEDSSMDAAETSSLEKGNTFGLQNESNASLSEIDASPGHSLNDEKDDDYVVVDSVEAMPKSKTERAGAIQMMELSKDAVDDDESESEDAGSDKDWEFV